MIGRRPLGASASLMRPVAEKRFGLGKLDSKGRLGLRMRRGVAPHAVSLLARNTE
jgi:hypothetical protein